MDSVNSKLVKPEAIFLDLHGVVERALALGDFPPGFWECVVDSVSPGIGDSGGAIYQAVARTFASFGVVGAQSTSLLHPLFCRALLEELGLAPSVAAVDKAYGCFVEKYCDLDVLYPDALRFIDRWSQSLPIAVVSNGNSRRIGSLLERSGILERLSTRLISGEWQYRKPDPEMFLWTAAQIGKSPNRCLMVGDRLDTDAAGADAAGLEYVHVDRKQTEEFGYLEGRLVVRDLDALSEMLC